MLKGDAQRTQMMELRSPFFQINNIKRCKE